MPADTTANSRISQAVLKQVVEENTRTMKRVNGNLNLLEERTRKLEITDARQDERIDNLNTKVKIDIAGTAAGAFFLAIWNRMG